jgi:AbrB family looped-hinge helix DNA binding protein
MSALLASSPPPTKPPLRLCLVILDGMTHKVGPKGQVVLPKPMRDRLGIKPGDEVLFDEGDHEILVRKAKTREEIIDGLRGALAGPGKPLTELLVESRRREREREDRDLEDIR